MLEWNDYVAQLLNCESSFDGISLSFDDGNQSFDVPPIIKASVLMLERMMECQGNFNILVFPERIQSIFIFTLVKLLFNISEGRIDHAYDPSLFKEGEKLKFGNAVVEFVAIEEKNGDKRMKIRLADNLTICASVEYFPLFQHTNTMRKLSTNKQFVEAKKQAKKFLSHLSVDEKHLKLLADHKTHMDRSIVNMTTILNTKELIYGCKLCGQATRDIILVGQADYEGNVRNIGSGQLSGTPAIVLASDLYAIVAIAQKGHPIESIIIDSSNANILMSQMDALDELMRLRVPITCVTDIVNSFDLQPFLDRQFNLWRWDETSITEKLYDVSPLSSDKKIKNCVKRKVQYVVTNGNEISRAIRKLGLHRGDVQSLSVQMLKLFDKLYSLSFTTLRETIPFDDNYLSQVEHTLKECSIILNSEKIYLNHKTFEDYSDIIDCLKEVFTRGYTLSKHKALGDHLLNEKHKSICIVVPERSDKKRAQEYWQSWCLKNLLNTKVYALYPSEYSSAQCMQFSVTIIVGWLKRAIMRKILYSFNTRTYIVFMYDYENRWKNYDTARWTSALDNSYNRLTIEKSFTTDKIEVSTHRFTSESPEPEDTPKSDELSEIETVLRENKYRQYVANGEQKSASETTEAIPVNYVGGYLAFYRTGHKVISATNIILNDEDKIDTVLPEQLKMGDFIVVRETDRDLIKEMADIILENSEKSNLRELATKWKEAFEIQKLFYTIEEIYQHLLDAGCTRGYSTVRGWLLDDDVIAPHSKQDLEHIAAVTESGVLNELLDQIYEAAQIVRNAHVHAGRVLSMQLRSRIVESLNEYGDIDPFNILEPIEMHVDGIGTVRVLKIIDIGSPVIVNLVDTNRLIDEE